ncbi:MAG: cytochrome C [Chloroflexi bacterium]|nr:cytochrome C [Chloroflexota bacterium]
MLDKRTLISAFGSLTILFVIATTGTVAAQGPGLTQQEQLGKLLFFDTNLSDPPGQACAVCHGPQVGFTGPDSATNAGGAVYQGAVPGRYGNRKPPAAAYAGDSPILHYDTAGETWVGGMFWDGRATGETLGDPLAEQAKGPFLNPLEQNNPSAQTVIDKVLASSYQNLFKSVCGSTYDVTTYYNCVGRSIAAFERSSEVTAFTSKYDAYVKGKAMLTGQEKHGLELFEGKAGCSGCHVAPLFTDYSYDNLGVPRNPKNPFYSEPAWNPQGDAWVDYGLGAFLKAAGYPETVYAPEMGKFKVPTLRNVDKRPTPNFIKAYSHNGYFKSLDEIVHFYNTRDVLPTCTTNPGNLAGITCWPAPEVAANINRTELGKLGLNVGEEKAIVAFLRTLTDGYK